MPVRCVVSFTNGTRCDPFRPPDAIFENRLVGCPTEDEDVQVSKTTMACLLNLGKLSFIGNVSLMFHPDCDIKLIDVR